MATADPTTLDPNYYNLKIEGFEQRSDFKFLKQHAGGFISGYGLTMLIHIKNLGPKDFPGGKIIIGELTGTSTYIKGPPEYELPAIRKDKRFTYKYRIRSEGSKIRFTIPDILDKEGKRTRLYGVTFSELIPIDASIAKTEIATKVILVLTIAILIATFITLGFTCSTLR